MFLLLVNCVAVRYNSQFAISISRWWWVSIYRTASRWRCFVLTSWWYIGRHGKHFINVDYVRCKDLTLARLFARYTAALLYMQVAAYFSRLHLWLLLASACPLYGHETVRYCGFLISISAATLCLHRPGRLPVDKQSSTLLGAASVPLCYSHPLLYTR